MTLTEMKHRMSSAEYLSWRDYYTLEPFGFPRQETRFADIMSGLFATTPRKPSKELIDPLRWRYKAPEPPSEEDAAALTVLQKIAASRS